MSLRTKMSIILLVATVIPFAIGGAAVHLVVAPAYRSAVRRVAEEQTRRLAEQVAWNIGVEASRLEKLAAWDQMRDLARKGPLTQAQAEDLDRRWSQLPISSEAVRSIIQNPIARELRWWRDTDTGVAGVVATDAHGRLIAATGKTVDVLQADEYWWQATYAGGQGRIYVSDVRAHPGAETLVIHVAVPVYADGAPGSPVVGVLKMDLDAPRLLESVRQANLGDRGEALVTDTHGGQLLAPPEGGLASRALTEQEFQYLRRDPVGSRTFPGEEGGLLTAWARVAAADSSHSSTPRMPGLYVVTERSAAEAFGPLWRVQFWMVVIGLVTVLLALAVGSWLADVLVVRQVRALARGMRELARGDFERAEAIADRLCRSHEGDGAASHELAVSGPPRREVAGRDWN
jgi:hypothetical protein